MSDPFDPVEHWLGADVELLPPQPGAFDRVHRRARRRKTVVALSAAAGAAVAITAAATLPQLVSVLQPKNGNQANVGPVASSSQSQHPGHHRSGSPAPGHSPTTSPCVSRPTGPKLSITSKGVAPAPGIEPSSVTFVNAAVGAVLGQTTSGSASCEAVAATSDYGRTWSKVDAPPAGPPNGDSGVSQIRFLEQDNGWAYGPGLYVTHDGGKSWAKAGGVPGRVIDLATVGASAYAVVASCAGAGSDYASGCTSFALYTSSLSSDNFQPVAGASGEGQAEPGSLQLTNSGVGYLLAGNVLFSGVPDGSSPWQAIAISAGKVPACLAANGHRVASGESGLIAPLGATDVYLLCQPATGGGGLLYSSTNAGATWQFDARVNAEGTDTSLAVAPVSGTLVLATSAGIYYSTDTRHWRPAKLAGQGPAGGFGFVGMTTKPNGVAVPAGPGSNVIYITTDGGQTWHPRRIA